MGSILLPIVEPPVISFLHHAYPLAIMGTKCSYLPWFYSNYVQLYTYYNDEYNGVPVDYKIDFYSYDGKYQRFPGMPEEWYKRDVFTQYDISITTFLEQCIDDGCYVEVFLDEFYIPGKIEYQKSSLIHQNLIYGYNSRDEVFHAIGYLNHGDFRRFVISYNNMIESFYRGPTSKLIRWDYGDVKTEFSMDLLKAYLTDFLADRNSFLSYNPKGSCFGVRAYREFRDLFLDRENHYIRNDHRNIRLLWEHKNIMVSRILYMQQSRLLGDASELLSQFTKIRDEFFNIKSMHLKFKITHDEYLLKRLVERLMLASEIEANEISNFIRLLPE